MGLRGMVRNCVGWYALSFVFLGNPASAQELPPTTAAEPSRAEGYIGLRVVSMRFPNISQGPEQKRLTGLVALQVGEPLDREAIRQSIQILHATGRFADVRVEADRSADGVIVTFITSPNYFVGQVSVDGAGNRPSPNQIANASKLQLGELFVPDKLDRALKNIQQLMEEDGFYRSRINVDETRHPDTQQVDFLIHVAPGPQAKIGDMVISGDTGYSEGQIRDIAKMRKGEYVSQQRVSNALVRLRNKYQKQGRWLAQVTITKSLYRDETNTVDYTLDIQPGPKVVIATEGMKISSRQLKKRIPVYEENALDDDLLNEGRRNLLNYLQTRGYFDAKVTVRRRGARTETLRVTYVIDPGQAHKLARVQLTGEKYFSEDQLRSLMQVQPAGRLLSHGRYDPGLLNSDVRSITNLYRNNGFQQVNVTSRVDDNYEGKSNQLSITVQIEEGPQQRVGTFRIVGATSLPQDVLENLNTQPGQAFSDSRIADDREIILNSYFNRGFPNAAFEAAAIPAPDEPNRMNVTFTVHEGEQQFVDQVLVSGLHFTRPFVAQRELQVKPGEPISQIDMLKTQQRLYDLGIFSQVDTAIQNPTGNEKSKNVLVQTQEAKRYTFNYGVGLEFQTGQPTSGAQGETGVSPRGSFSVTRLNFRGRNHTLTFKGNVGRLQQRALVSSDVPRWFSSENWKLTVTAFYDNTIDVSTFTSKRLEGSLQAQQTISKSSTMVYSFTFRRVQASDLQISQEDVPLLSQPVRVGMPGFTYVRDRRDNPLESTKGNYTTVDAGVSSDYFGSEASFSRLLIQNSTYYAFGKKRPQERKFVFARSTRIGLENPFGTTITLQPGDSIPAGSPHQAIPFPEKFLSGGGNSHRGFGLNQAGPRDPVTGFPLGGAALFLNNLELRFPPVNLPFVQDNLSFAVFHDMGNVFTNGNDMVHSLLRWHQSDPALCRQDTTTKQCSYNYISHAVGIGVRYKTPIGPVRFDFGYNLNATVFPSCLAAPSTNSPVSTFCADNSQKDAKGNPTLTFFQPQVTRRFNVSFSIGQTF